MLQVNSQKIKGNGVPKQDSSRTYGSDAGVQVTGSISNLPPVFKQTSEVGEEKSSFSRNKPPKGITSDFWVVFFFFCVTI